MKKSILFIISIMLLLSSCQTTNKSNTKDNLSAIQDKLTTTQNKLNDYDMIYDKEIAQAISKYCKYYLSFNNKPAKERIDKLKRFLTNDYYLLLSSRPYFEENGGLNSDYSFQQSTALDNIFYENIKNKIQHDDIILNTQVIALCYQTIINNNNAKSCRIAYSFNFTRNANKWLISSVEKV